jgi:transcription factor SFP1
MEKEKPYKCDVCGKRYKNLNGLKYVSVAIYFPRASTNTIQHKQHSPPCNPDLKLNSHLATAGLGPLGVGVNMGLPGIGEEGMM